MRGVKLGTSTGKIALAETLKSISESGMKLIAVSEGKRTYKETYPQRLQRQPKQVLWLYEANAVSKRQRNSLKERKL